MIKSPLNYTGNKYRILNQLEEHFPKQIGTMIDLFCGGATVGLNVNAKKVIFVDKNERVIDLLIFLSKQNFEDLLSKIEKIIEKFGLSYSYKYGYSKYRQQCNNLKDNNGLKDYNSLGYYKLRDYYNSICDKTSNEANTILYVLMVYAFNNDIRFNSNGEFNLPVGKTDMNKMNVEKIKAYIKRVNEIDAEFYCLSFTSSKFKNLLNSVDFVYMDPPYLVGDAVYNSEWGNKQEYELLDFIDDLIRNKINFALSNVMSKVGKINEPLSYWCYKNNELVSVYDIDYNYRSSSYNKIDRNAKEREIVVINKEYSHED